MRHSHSLRLRSIAGLFVFLAGCAVAPGDADTEEQEPEQIAETSSELSQISCAKSSSQGYTAGKPTPITVVRVDSKPVEQATANAYYVMAKAAAADGVNIKINSGFRTMAEQERLYGCYKNCNCNSCNLAARPGYSNHQSGHALDLNTSASGVLNWLNKNGAKYGFKRTVPSEAWHWEWWGGGPGGGPCGGGGAAAAAQTCASATLGKEVPENTCVQASSDNAWYQCVDGDWLDRKTVAAACVSEHPRQ